MVARGLRFGRMRAADDGDESTSACEWSAEWLLKRNCSLKPSQLMAFFASIAVVSLGIAAACWMQGAPLVMPFASLELLALGTALLLYARHAADREAIVLHADRLVVEHASGARVERVEFAPDWVRVAREPGSRSLVELSGQGRRISVGRFVRPELRRQLADELRWALRRSQGQPRHVAGTSEDH